MGVPTEASMFRAALKLVIIAELSTKVTTHIRYFLRSVSSHSNSLKREHGILDPNTALLIGRNHLVS